MLVAISDPSGEQTIKSAAAKRDEKFTAWAVAVLLRAARRELKK